MPWRRLIVKNRLGGVSPEQNPIVPAASLIKPRRKVCESSCKTGKQDGVYEVSSITHIVENVNHDL
jgi:hypothetical protein